MISMFMAPRGLILLLAVLLGMPPGAAWTICACAPAAHEAGTARKSCCEKREPGCGVATRCASGRGVPGPGLIDPEACGCVRVAAPAAASQEKFVRLAAPEVALATPAPAVSFAANYATRFAVRPAAAHPAPSPTPPPRRSPLLI